MSENTKPREFHPVQIDRDFSDVEARRNRPTLSSDVTLRAYEVVGVRLMATVPMTWGTVYRKHLSRGEDHGSAAFAADQWEKRQRAGRWKNCPSTHCERRQECTSPHECSAAKETS